MAILSRLFGAADAVTMAADRADRVIVDAPFHERPFPHLVIDNVLPPALVGEMLRHWPARECFEQEVPGNYVCAPLTLPDGGSQPGPFWRRFADPTGAAIARASVARFAE